ncbi:placenta-specific protein 1 [Heterocephalus glaber]|uniref:Placenta-specific protein 1 n=1 Tax=Heterocephalus glaber TaxID=10181 RepID=A0AAX6P1W0_HETGA|nr:placenta-specific protein 1 [Heterocephalus glaber]
MKDSVLLCGSLLLSLLVWKSCGLEPAVTSMCTEDWLLARMKRWPFDNGTEVRTEDIHLGANSSVTRVLSLSYEFSYPVTSCGINKIVFQKNDVFLLSEIQYRSAQGGTRTFQVFCLAKRVRFSSVVPFRMRGDTVNPPSGNSQRTKEENQPPVFRQSNVREPSFVCFNKDRLPGNYWVDNVCSTTSSPPPRCRSQVVQSCLGPCFRNVLVQCDRR